MQDINKLLTEYNTKLKDAGIKLTIQRRDKRLQLRGTLPVKQYLLDSRGEKPYQQVINLGSLAIANESGIKYAFKQAKIVYGQLQSNVFNWNDWLINEKCVDIDLLQIWKIYEEHKKQFIKTNTLNLDYKNIENHLTKIKNLGISEPQKVKEYLLNELSLSTAKKVLMYIKAAYKYAHDIKKVLDNPFDDIKINIKVSYADEYDIKPFTRLERDIIIKTFENHCKYKNYADLVKFLFFTGCRPSEAIALQWKHITDKNIIFEQTLNRFNGVESGLKRQKFRVFPINSQLLEILLSLKVSRGDINKNDFVFLTKSNKLINFNYFQSIIWKNTVIQELLDDNILESYKKPYQMRHTFITLCLESGVNVKDVAAWVGNTPGIIYKHYAGVNRLLDVPEL